MTEQQFFYLIIAIVVADFVLERTLSFLNRKNARQPIPNELDGIYDEESYQKSQQYNDEVGRFSTISSIFSFVLLLAALIFGWFGIVDSWIRSFSPFDMVTSLLFFAVLMVIMDLISIPFSLYRNFVIEEKYGFNKMTAKTFILDKLKGYVLTAIIGGILLAVLIYMVNSIGSGFWWYFWIVITGFTLVMNLFYTSWILPLFNKLRPVEEGELRSSIESFSQKVNFPLKNIFVMDGSKRSSKGNAFFSGLGSRKKVVLFDTLIDKHNVEELTAVFAHEVGHFKKKHILVSTVIAIAQSGLMLYLLSLMIYNSEVSWAMGGSITSIHLNILAFGILYTPVSHLMGIATNIISRKHEYEADAYARDKYAGEPLILALKKMSADHLTNLTPHPAFVFVHYSHPPLLHRIRALSA